MIENPVLPGSHPDPSVVRVGDDFFVATSTFEWFPGIRLHHSRDLVHWRPCGYALTRREQLDLRGVPDSGGVWAASLSHDGHRFFLAYAVVDARQGWPLTSVVNYLVTAPQIDGPWSDPVFLGGGGWDASVFHDRNGRAHLVRASLDLRPGRSAMRGIVVQDLSVDRRQLDGEPRLIYAGTSAGCTEGPQIFWHEDRYYLLTAEGGTSWSHAAMVARADQLDGPYEPDPAGPFLTSRDAPELPLQKSGHASLVTTAAGDWYAVHLCARPLPGRHPGRCPLGRETALQPVRFIEGWPRLAHGDPHPRLSVPPPRLPRCPWPAPPPRDDFDDDVLGPAWNTRREPLDGWASLTARPGHLRIRGRAPLFAPCHVSVVARRWPALTFAAATTLQFAPDDDQQTAGLVCLYDTRDYVYAHVSGEGGRRILRIVQVAGGRPRAVDAWAPLSPGGVCHLRVEVDRGGFHFSWAEDGGAWHGIGPLFDAAQLADETDAKDGFTGAFVGVAVEDPVRHAVCADFDQFTMT